MQRQPSNARTLCYSLLKLRQSSRERTPERSTTQTTVQNDSSLNVSTAPALLYNAASCQTGGNLPLHDRGVSSLPCAAEELRHGATHHCRCYLGGTRLRESEQGVFLREDVGNVVFWPLLTSLIQLCVRDRLDTAVLGGGRSLCSFTLLKVRAGRYQHRDIFFCFFQVHCWKV